MGFGPKAPTAHRFRAFGPGLGRVAHRVWVLNSQILPAHTVRPARPAAFGPGGIDCCAAPNPTAREAMARPIPSFPLIFLIPDCRTAVLGQGLDSQT
jgi:hypothetical protein